MRSRYLHQATCVQIQIDVFVIAVIVCDDEIEEPVVVHVAKIDVILRRQATPTAFAPASSDLLRTRPP